MEQFIPNYHNVLEVKLCLIQRLIQMNLKLENKIFYAKLFRTQQKNSTEKLLVSIPDLRDPLQEAFDCI